ncbi:cytochrome c oxidase assembly protein [Gryllotalpicola sp.]|uniref:cytochrome c oxidase assembly protein n=1 Tax=Gryllotalpicola sp. TaxID=1932787 RepID=UPI0026157E06|nr:cytochrome c oxidase assembly protein [Gryllotalpicola sp.]
MPPLAEILTTWRVDPWAITAILVAAVLYLTGVQRYNRAIRSEAATDDQGRRRWSINRTLCFFLLGLGSYLWIQCGFLGVWSHDLRWAFTTRIAFLLFLTPYLMALGKPVALARGALGADGRARLERLLRCWPLRLLGNTTIAPLVALVGFGVFLTPLAAPLRLEAGWAVLITLGVPLIGLAMSLPITEDPSSRSGMAITAEFLIAFAELVADAIPGIVLRINYNVLDGVTAMATRMPAWFPSPLRDQQLSGDSLWLIAELSDIPVIAFLFFRWTRADKRDAKAVDDLSDEEWDRQVREHLRGPR